MGNIKCALTAMACAQTHKVIKCTGVLGNLEWCIRILQRKSGFLSEVFVFCSAGNVGDFCSFKGYGAGATRPKIQKFVKKLYFAFSVKQNALL